MRKSAVLLSMLALLAFGAGAAAWKLKPVWDEVVSNTADLADAHLRHDTAHPGWSFPSRVYSAAAPVASTRLSDLQATGRGYEVQCPPEAPGQYCPESKAASLRGGRFADGEHSPQEAPGLEPILLGVLIGPDAEVRWHLALEEAPEKLVAAILAAEDAHFYDHAGINLPALLRATWVNLQGGSYQQGASTITMQVVRSFTQDREKTIRRKVEEILSALAIERHLSKDQILEAYLNAPYLGQSGGLSICGFRAAAQYYYGVDVAGLSLGQAATLAGMLPAPARYAPDRNPEAARARRDLVLSRMAAAGWDVAEALAEPIDAVPHDPLPKVKHPAYLQAARGWLEENVESETLYGGGLHIFTAMDVAAQITTEAVIPEQTAFLETVADRRLDEPLESVAILVDAQSGHLTAIYGGTQQASTDFSRATQARRQAGSAFKPLVYALAFTQTQQDAEQSWRPHHTVSNKYRTFEGTNGWRPKNILPDYSKTSTLGNALVHSQNVATATLLQQVGGPERLIEFATGLGFDTSRFPAELGLALGQAEVTPMEMARFTATVANLGVQVTGAPVTHILDARGALLQEVAGRGPRVMEQQAAALTRELMGMVARYGAGTMTRYAGGKPGFTGDSFGKTGTTDQERDLWYIGGTPDYASVVWLGYDQPTRVGSTAAALAAPLWGWWMRALHDGEEDQTFDQTIAFKRHWLCSITGKRPNDTCRSLGFPFLPEEKPEGTCEEEHEPVERTFKNIWQRRREKQEAEREEKEQAAEPADATTDP